MAAPAAVNNSRYDCPACICGLLSAVRSRARARRDGDRTGSTSTRSCAACAALGICNDSIRVSFIRIGGIRAGQAATAAGLVVQRHQKGCALCASRNAAQYCIFLRLLMPRFVGQTGSQAQQGRSCGASPVSPLVATLPN